VKHPRPDSISGDEEQNVRVVGGQVRTIVADFLATMPLRFDLALFLERVERLTELVAFWGTRINLTAAPADPSEIAFHILDSLAPMICGNELLHSEFDPRSRFLDLGSGAGFPGLVLASASAAHFTLIESRRKRASFLAVAAAEMGLKNVAVERRLAVKPYLSSAGPPAQSGDFAPSSSCAASITRDSRATFDAITAKAFAVAPLFLSIAAPALKRGGIAIFYANPGQELAQHDAVKAGLRDFREVKYAIPRHKRMVRRILGLWRRC
jgi:16S rRNA G527 N7-methylase RsmG